MSQPFRPLAAATVNIDVAAASARIPIGGTPASLRIYNDGTETVWITFGNSTVVAALASGTPVPAGAVEVFGFGSGDTAGINVAAIAAGPTGKIYFTPGSGI